MSTPGLMQFFDLTVTGVGSSLGIGLFVLVGELIKNVTGPAVVISIFIAGLAAILTGLCFAELGIRFLKIDSIYMYCYSCNGENLAFLVGWTLLLSHLAGVASILKGVIVFIDAFINNKISNFLSETATVEFEYGSSYFDYLVLILVFVLMVFLIIGLKDSLLIKRIFTICNVAFVLSIVVAESFRADPKNWYFGEPSEGGLKKYFAPFGFSGVVKGAALSYYGLLGFERICLLGNEMRKPQRNLPLSILLSLFIVLLAYEGTSIVLTMVHPYDQLNPNAALPFSYEGTVFKWIIAGGAFFGFQTSLFGAIFPLPKIIYFMANDGLLFYFLGSTYGRNKSPVVAAVISYFLTAVLGGFFNFKQLVSLTVISTLFVCTIIAVDILLLRYFSEKEENGNRTEDFVNWPIHEESFTIKEALRSFFHRKTDVPSKLTQKVITANIIIFCACSIGLSVIVICFSELLFKLGVQVLLLAIIFLIILIISLISMACQPKSQKYLPFMVPWIPFTPCLSIFLNIFLMISFGSPIWVLFSIWMALGISLYVTWFCLKYCRGQTGKDSLYEINRLNAVKLNESIWKIRLEKKSFYEGAINPVFSDEYEDKSEDFKNINENGITIISNEGKVSVQMQHAETIVADDIDIKERTNSLTNEAKLVSIDSKNITEKTENSECQPQLTLEDGNHLECVAEIHMEEIFSQESAVLEIVDNTYKFLKEINEDLSNDEIPEQNSVNTNSTFIESNILESEVNRNIPASEGEKKRGVNLGQIGDKNVPFPPPLPEHLIGEENEYILSQDTGSGSSSLNELLVESIQFLKNRENNKDKNPNNDIEEDKNIFANTKESTNLEENRIKNDDEMPCTDKISSLDKNHVKTSKTPISNERMDEENISFTVKGPSETHKNENRINTDINNLNEKQEKKEGKTKYDDYKKIKNFKERLNELLKNQINMDSALTRVSLNSKSDSKNDEILENNEKSDDYKKHQNIKTLKKSEIKNKLELLLAKGPPKRASLKNSFNAGRRDISREYDANNVENSELNLNLNQINSDTSETSFTKDVGQASQNLAENVHVVCFHTLKGTPWLSQIQGAYQTLTHLEQIDNGPHLSN